MTILRLVRAHSEQRYFLLRLHVILFAVIVGALWLIVPRFGMMGAVAVIVGANLSGKFWIAIRMGRVIGVARQDWKLLSGVARVAIAAAVAAMVTAAIRLGLPPMKPLFAVIVAGLFYTAAYLLAIVLMKIPDTEERGLVWRVVGRLAPAFGAGRKA